MTIDELAERAARDLVPLAPPESVWIARDELAAGESFCGIVDLIEDAPQVVPADFVDEFEKHIPPLEDTTWGRVARKVVARYRELAST